MTSKPFQNLGRPPSTVRKDDWHVSIEQRTSLYFRMKYMDPLTQKTRVGALSELCNRLLKAEMDRELALAKENNDDNHSR